MKLKRVMMTGRETPEGEILSIVLYTPAFKSVLEKHHRSPRLNFSLVNKKWTIVVAIL